MPPFRAAVIGCGLIGSRFERDSDRIGVFTHAGAYAACAETSLIALCDPDALALTEAGDRWQVRQRYTDPSQLLAESGAELVSICTPNATHAAILRAAFDCPTVRGVFAEKPLALTLEEARGLAASAAVKPTLVNYFRRFTSNHQRLRQMLTEGTIGRIVAVNGFYTKGTFHNGTHWFDLARWLVGEVMEVQGFNSLGETTDDPTLDVRLRFEQGATGTLIGLPSGNFSLFEMDLIGSNGRVRLSDNGWSIQLSRVAASRYYSGYAALQAEEAVAGDMRDPALAAVKNLVAHLRDAAMPLACTAQDGLKAMLIAEAARRSLSSGRAEMIPLC
jgi:predicted dehydrogenase